MFAVKLQDSGLNAGALAEYVVIEFECRCSYRKALLTCFNTTPKKGRHYRGIPRPTQREPKARTRDYRAAANTTPYR